MLAVCFGASLALFAARASAYSCGPARELVPLQGATFPGDGQILDICYYYSPDGTPRADARCDAPVLKDAAGRRIELIEERRVRSADSPRLITAYQPASVLAAGRYLLSAATAGLGLVHEFDVVEAIATPPALPVLSTLEFSMASEAGAAAVFTFEPFDATLAVERDGLGQDPLEALDVSGWWSTPDEPREYRLARELCQVNFPALDYGVSTTLRFGLLDARNAFSGWTEPLLVTFPTREEVEAQQAAQQAAAAQAQQERIDRAVDGTPPGWCALPIGRRRPPLGSALLPLLALSAACALRRRA